MRRFRFTIGSLLGVVLFAAVAFAALREATDLWDSAVFTLTLGALLTSVALAVHRKGDRRAYWVGFALFGAAYVVGSLTPPIESRLLTTKGLAYLDAQIPGREQVYTLSLSVGTPVNTTAVQQGFAFLADGQTLATSTPSTARLWGLRTGKLLAGPFGTSENFVRIGHSLFALLAAFAGGSLSRRLAARSRQAVAESADTDHHDTPAAGSPSA